MREAGHDIHSNTPLSLSPCNLCPRTCGALRGEGERGLCGCSDEVLVARAALHYWEEPPISGESGSGTVFFVGCPLHCVYCQNADIAAGKHGKPVSSEQLARIFLNLQEQGALNVNCVTPTHYALQIREAVALARERGLCLPIVWNTSSYERVQAIEELRGAVDVFLADYKYADEQLASRYSHAPDYPQVALKAIEAMVNMVGEPRFDEHSGQRRLVGGVIIRHLVLPAALHQSKRALHLLFERFGNTVLYSIMNQYTPVMPASVLERFPELGARVPDAEYEELLDFADELGIDDYFWQQGPTAKESFIPAWDGTGVE